MEYWIVFFLSVIVFNISPGPDVLYILSKTIAHGKKIGFASSLGVCVGAFVHVFAAALGLSAILMTSPVAFKIVQYLGVVYLLFLAYKSFKNSSLDLAETEGEKSDCSFWGAFRQGVLIDILNPKVAIFFIAFLPQFIREGHGSTSFQFTYLGLIIILVSLIVEFFYIMLAATLAKKIKESPTFKQRADKCIGGVFIALGIKLALAS